MSIEDAYQVIKDIRQQERDLCKRDVCMYCGGRALMFDRIPVGPNSAGNYVHHSKDHPISDMLCVASSIFARERFESLPSHLGADAPLVPQSPVTITGQGQDEKKPIARTGQVCHVCYSCHYPADPTQNNPSRTDVCEKCGHRAEGQLRPTTRNELGQLVVLIDSPMGVLNRFLS